MQKIVILLFICLVMFVFLSSANACNSNTARLLAKAYALSQPLSTGNLEYYLRSNRQAFQESGRAIKCAKKLGTFLQTNGLRTFDSHAYERVMEIAPPELAGSARETAQSLQSGSLDAYTIGKELLWLSQVLPAATQGNYEPFNNTGTYLRQQMRQYMRIVGPILRENQGLINHLNKTLINPLIEEQITMLALMLPN